MSTMSPTGPPASRALDPALVAAIDDLELAARLIVEGSRAGGHRSPFHGFSTEFSQHRPYRAGDDFRHLDWKVLARTDRLYTRQFRETTNMSVMIVVDASASMAFPAAATGGRSHPRAGDAISKFRYAVLIAAALAYVVVDAGDRAGLMTSDGDALRYVPARGGRSHLQTILAQLQRLAPQGRWQPARVIARAADLLDRRGLVIVLSDFYDDEDGTSRELRRVMRRGHDVSALQILSRPEIDFTFTGATEFEDLETGATHIADAAGVAREYRQRVAAFLETFRDTLRADGIDYVQLLTDQPLDRALRSFLIQRGAGAAGTASSERA
jgi:uncharacterized protein (DUF58 family)